MYVTLPPYAPKFKFDSAKIKIETEDETETSHNRNDYSFIYDETHIKAVIPKLIHWIPKQFLSVIDIGCYDTTFVNSLHLEGVFSVALASTKQKKNSDIVLSPINTHPVLSVNYFEPFALTLKELAQVQDSDISSIAFSVVIAHILDIGIGQKSIDSIFNNISRLLIPNGIVIVHIRTIADKAGSVISGISSNPKAEWAERLTSIGWECNDHIGEFLEIGVSSDLEEIYQDFYLCLTRVGETPLFSERLDRNAYVFQRHGQPQGAIARLLPNMYGFRSDPVVVCDAGVRGGFESIWNGFEEFLHLIGIDIDANATSAIDGQDSTYRRSMIKRPVGAGRGHAILNRTRNDVASSFLPTDWNYLKRFPQMIPGEIVGCEPLDFFEFKAELAACGVPRVDYLKLDLEGFELEALKGLGPLRETLLCVSVEVFFNPYKFGSPTYGMIEEYLRPLGFSLFDLQLERWNRHCVTDVNSPLTWYGKSGQVMWGQAVFLKDPIQSGENLNPHQAARLAFIADVFGFKDYALELVTEYKLLKFA